MTGPSEIQTRIDVDRPWTRAWTVQETEVTDVNGRAEQVEAALRCFAPVVRPLALSLDRGWREPDTGLLARGADPEPPIAIVVAEELQKLGAVFRPTVAEPPVPTSVRELNPKAVRAFLGQHIGEVSDHGQADWRSLETLATAVAVSAPSVVVQGRVVQGRGRGDETWVGGPLASEGFGGWAPLALRFDAEDPRVRLDLRVFWTRWTEVGTEEHAGLMAAIDELERSGWATE